jgi:murein L,D-transpeptidase YafK
MKTLIILSAFIGLSNAQAQIPPKPVAIPANCERMTTIDEMQPSEVVDTKHPIDLILVSKSKRKIYFMSQGQVTYAFTSAFGDGVGNKIHEGDERTPEGTYSVSSKNTKSDFHKSLGVSYPNAADTAYAQKYKVSPGGAIMIHGMSNKITLANSITVANAINLTDWTQGCVAVRNDQIDAVFPHVKVGTKIEICPREQN